MTLVSHYGVHRTSDGISYLHQGGAGENAVGIPNPSPFVVDLRRPCNHQIRLSEAIDLSLFDFLDDPLVQALSPVPHIQTKVYFLEASSLVYTLVQEMAEMSAPIRSVVHPLWMRGKIPLREFLMTNIQPLIITQLSPKQTGEVQQIIRASYSVPRTVVLIGDQDVVAPQPAVRIKTKLGLQHVEAPWRRLGASLLRAHMRGLAEDGSELDRGVDGRIL